MCYSHCNRRRWEETRYVARYQSKDVPYRFQRDRVFAATKIWTGDESQTRAEAARPERRWGLDRFDLLQVHNLVGWQGHLETLKQMKAEGVVRYIGITTSHGRRHHEFEQIMEREPLDFVQLTYNVLDREVEDRLLPLARERGIGVIVNRPFQGGSLFRRFQSEPLPEWAPDAGAGNWAEFFLKYIIAHPAVTCAIPATSKVEHMRENMAALKDEILRELGIDMDEGRGSSDTAVGERTRILVPQG